MAFLMALLATAGLAILMAVIDLAGGDLSWSTALVTLAGFFVINLITQRKIAGLYR